MVDAYAAHDWLANHEHETKKYSWLWIAIDEKGVLAHAQDIKTLVNNLKNIAVKTPLITRIPTKEDANFILFIQ